jgi:hypothetical protein
VGTGARGESAAGHRRMTALDVIGGSAQAPDERPATPVVKRIVKLGDVQGVVLDTRVLRLAILAVGDEVEVSV